MCLLEELNRNIQVLMELDKLFQLKTLILILCSFSQTALPNLELMQMLKRHISADEKPGLLDGEKKLMLPFAISSFILFYLGAIFAFYIVVPVLINFFINTAPESVKIMTDISQFFNFTIKIIIGFGIAFQVPIFTIISVRLGIFTKETLRKSRPYFIILFFIIGMFLTPPDILSQVFLALPMWMLFELGILISKDKD